MRHKRKKIKFKYVVGIIAVITAIFVMMVAMFWFANVTIRDTEEDRVVANVRSIGMSHADTVSDFWNGTVQDMEIVAASLEQSVEEGFFSSEETTGTFEGAPIVLSDILISNRALNLIQSYLSVTATFDMTALIRPDGYTYRIQDDETARRFVNVSDRDYFIRAMSGSPAFSGLQTSKVDGVSIYSLAVPVYIDDQVAAVLLNTLLANTMNTLMNELNEGEAKSIIINKDFDVVASYDDDITADIVDNLRKDSSNPSQNSVLQSTEQRHFNITIRDKDYYSCVTNIHNTYFGEDALWQVVTIIPTDSVNAYVQKYIDLSTLLALSLTLAVVSCVVVIILLVHFSKKEQHYEVAKYRTAMQLFKKYTFEYNRDSDRIVFSESAKIMLDLEKTEYVFRDILRQGYLSYIDYDRMRQGSSTDQELSYTVYSNKLSRHFKISLYYIEDRAMKGQFAIGAIEDVTDNEVSRREWKRKAQIDSLTQLYNRETTVYKVDKYLTETTNVRSAIFLIDIDEFKLINDCYGHFTGDQVLIKIGAALSSLFPNESEALTGRIGGDEFCVFAKNIPTSKEIGAIAQKISDTISLIPIVIEKEDLIACSIGIAISPRHGEQFDILYQCADNALYKAKEKIGSAFTIYDNLGSDLTTSYHHIEENTVQTVEDNLSLLLSANDGNGKAELEKIMLNAIANDEFHLYKQAKISTEGKAPEAETLARWDSPKYGLLMPNKFIALFEKANIIDKFDLHILEKAIAECSGQNALYHLSVNQSLKTITTPSFLKKLQELLINYDYNPSFLTIEITERGLFTGIRSIGKIIKQLHELGFCISIDDFGSGFTTLSILKDLEIDEIKIDKTFVDSHDGNAEKSSIIVRHICNMAIMLGIKTVAEGVEDEQQATRLANYGCHYLQGYYFDRAVDDVTFRKNAAAGLYSFPKKTSLPESSGNN